MEFVQNRPLYLQVKEDIAKRIDSGEWKEAEQILTENEFAEYYQTSRATVRHALSEIESDGLIERYPGKGTIVSRERIKPKALNLNSFTESMKRLGMETSTKTIDIDFQIPPRQVKEGLDLENDERVWRVKRLRIANGEPMCIHDLYIPPDLKVSTRDIQNMKSYYSFIQDQYQLKPFYANESLTATIVNEAESELLNVPIGDPLILVWRTTFTEMNKPIEVVKILFIAKRYQYHLKLFAD